LSSKQLYYLIYKPYKILSQFTDEEGNKGLGSIYKLPKDIYPVGRLDLDSEGLLILTNDQKLNAQLLHPAKKHKRIYWSEIDGKISNESIQKLSNGVHINLTGNPYLTKKCNVKSIDGSAVPERSTPVNYKKHPVRSWIEIKLIEGKNRQVRKMTAKVGHPTLRLIRVAIDDLSIGNMKSGDITQISKNTIYKKLKLFFD